MTATDVNEVTWDLSHLLEGREDAEAAVFELLDRADVKADEIAALRGTVAALEAATLAEVMRSMAEMSELIGRAGAYASLRFSTDTTDPSRGALMQKVQERATAINTKLIFFELEWAALPDDKADALLEHEELAFCRHHLASERRYKEHLLSEAEEKILSEKSVTGRSAWARLYSEQQSTIQVVLDDGRVGTLEEGLSRLSHPEREVRRAAAEAITEGLKPGLRTRAFIFNTLLADKATDDRLRGYPTWISSRNLANEAPDESVATLVEAVRKRNDIPQRWYALKARLLGLDKIADYDRMASVAESEEEIGWDEARTIVLDAYGSFSEEIQRSSKNRAAVRCISSENEP